MNKIYSFIYNTVQIECPKTDGKTYLGTGFFVQFNPQKDGVTSEPIKLLLTNRHVMENAIALTLKFCVKNTDGSPNNQSHLSIYIPDIQNHVINHPNKDVFLIPS